MIGLSATGATMRSGPLMRWLSFSTGTSSSSLICGRAGKLVFTLPLQGRVKPAEPARRTSPAVTLGVWGREATVAKLKVMCARSMHVAVGALGRAFARGSRPRGRIRLRHRRRACRPSSTPARRADVVILSMPAIDKLEQAGALVPGSRRDVARTFIALCIRAGAPMPDFSTRRGVQAPAGRRQRHRHQRSGGRRLGRRPSRQDVRARGAGRDDARPRACRSRPAPRSPAAWSRARPRSG